MPWFSLLKGLLSLVNHVSKIMADKQLLDAGEYKAIARYNEQTIRKIRKTNDARRAASLVTIVPNDTNDRDN